MITYRINQLTTWCSVSLTIVTNERCFNPHVSSTGDRHLGTHDRFDASIQHDHPGKAIGCLEAARMLQSRTLPEAFSTILGPIVGGNGKALDPIGLVSSSRMPDLKDLESGHDEQYLRNLAASVVRSKASANASEDPFISDFGKEADITPRTLDAAGSLLEQRTIPLISFCSRRRGILLLGWYCRQAITPDAIWRWASVTSQMPRSQRSTQGITKFSSVPVIAIGS